MPRKTDKERKINAKKDVAFSGIYSILGAWGSAAYIVGDILLNDFWAAVVSLLIMLAIVIISAITNQVISTELTKNHKSKKAYRWIEKIKKQSGIAGYTGIILLLISFLVNICKLSII